LIIYFLLYLFLEVFVSLQFAAALGAGLTFLEIIGSAVVGLIILANFRSGLVENLTLLKSGHISQEQFAALNIFKIVGAILLIIPGFMTDIIGVVFQFGSLAAPISKIFIKPGTYNRPPQQSQSRRYEDDTIIDVEIIEKKGDN